MITMILAIVLFVMSIGFFMQGFRALSGREDELQKTARGVAIGYLVCGGVCLLEAKTLAVIFFL